MGTLSNMTRSRKSGGQTIQPRVYLNGSFPVDRRVFLTASFFLNPMHAGISKTRSGGIRPPPPS